MAATLNKQQLLTQVHAILKKKLPAAPEASDPRTVLEEVLFAILRENTIPEQAQLGYQKLKECFYDFNEVRVSSIAEVAEIFAGLPDAGSKAKRIVEFLQEHFERTFSFVLEDLEKKGLKQAAKQLARYKDHGVNDFVVALVTQRALGGHAIPLDDATIRVLNRLGILEAEIEDLESARGTLEHFIPKAKGQEFTDLMIQHADATCTVEEPHCSTCPLKADCITGQDLIAKGKSKAKPR